MEWFYVGISSLLIAIFMFLCNKYWIKKIRRYPVLYLTTIRLFLILGIISLVIWGLEKLQVGIVTDKTLQFEITATIAVILGLFSVFSFYVAKKVEGLLRLKIRSFEDFTEYGLKVLHDQSKDYRLMLIYPFIGVMPTIEKKVRKLSQESGKVNINNRIEELSKEDNFKIISGNRKVRIDFLKEIENIGKLTAKGKELLEKEENKTDPDFLQGLKKRKIQFLGKKNSIHIISSSYQVVWGNVEGPGKCVGFWSGDIHIVESFKRVFEEYWDNMTVKTDD